VFTLRDALPFGDWPEDVRTLVLERLRDDPERLRVYERRVRLLEFANPDDRSHDLEIALADVGRLVIEPHVWWLPDPGAPGARQTFAFGSTDATVHSVRWKLEDGRVYRCPTLPVPGEAARRGFVMPVPPVGCGNFAALDADRSVLENCFEDTRLNGGHEPPEEIQRLRELPKIGEGELAESGRWVLRAGMVGENLGDWLTREPPGGGSGAIVPLLSHDEVVRINSVAGRAHELQIAVGQLAKHVDAVQAFDQRGTRCHAEHLWAPHLAVDYFLAWTRGPALGRIDALDAAGERLGETRVSVPPQDT
jgi:hypothetical protein